MTRIPQPCCLPEVAVKGSSFLIFFFDSRGTNFVPFGYDILAWFVGLDRDKILLLHVVRRDFYLQVMGQTRGPIGLIGENEY